jgi:hypothetical protein
MTVVYNRCVELVGSDSLGKVLVTMGLVVDGGAEAVHNTSLGPLVHGRIFTRSAVNDGVRDALPSPQSITSKSSKPASGKFQLKLLYFWA